MPPQFFAQVNKDFGSIFSTLLPGARAKLEPQDGCGPEEGLIIKAETMVVTTETTAAHQAATTVVRQEVEVVHQGATTRTR